MNASWSGKRQWMYERLLLIISSVVSLLGMPCSFPLPTSIFRKKAVFLLETLTVYLTSSPPFFVHELGFDTNIHPVIQGNVSPIPFWDLTMISLSQYDGFFLPVWSGLACEPPGQWDIVGIKQWSGKMCPCSWRTHHKWWLLSDLRLCHVWPGSLKMFCLLEATKWVLWEISQHWLYQSGEMEPSVLIARQAAERNNSETLPISDPVIQATLHVFMDWADFSHIFLVLGDRSAETSAAPPPDVIESLTTSQASSPTGVAAFSLYIQPYQVGRGSPHTSLSTHLHLFIWFSFDLPFHVLCSAPQSCLFVALWTVVRQAPLCMGFSRQKCWNGLPFPPPGNLPNTEIEHTSLKSPVLAGGFFTNWHHLGSHRADRICSPKTNWDVSSSDLWAYSVELRSMDPKAWMLLAFEFQLCHLLHVWP